ncbi:unnamed protein product [Rotaria sp. Silwood1]|nr:unnamed protein product [Rotaria sp. Silwood1]
MKLYQDSLNLIANNFNINDCVGIAIHTVDKTNTDPKHLPCLIIEKNEKNNVSLYKLICQYGISQNTFEAGQFMNLKDACSNELKQTGVSTLKPIAIIEDSKLYSRGSTTGRTCNCQGNCATKSCSWVDFFSWPDPNPRDVSFSGPGNSFDQEKTIPKFIRI